jgi:hypothetical protein
MTGISSHSPHPGPPRVCARLAALFLTHCTTHMWFVCRSGILQDVLGDAKRLSSASGYKGVSEGDPDGSAVLESRNPEFCV